MNPAIAFAESRATTDQIRAHLARCDDEFTPPLSSRVDIAAYAGKLHDRSFRFEAWEGDSLVGLVAIYLDGPVGVAHISNVSVEPRHGCTGIGSRLLGDAIRFARERHAVRVSLEVACDTAAIRLYTRHGFATCDPTGPILKMHLDLSEHRQ